MHFRGDDAVLAEVKPGRLSRKRLIVPLGGATVSRDFVRLPHPSEALMQESSPGQGFDDGDLGAITAHYGAEHTYRADELESSGQRAQRAAAQEAARQRVAELEAAAARSATNTDTVRQRVEDARADLQSAEDRQRQAEQELDAARRDAGGESSS